MEKTKLSREEIENQFRSDNAGISEEELAKLVEEKLASLEAEASKSAAKKTVKNGKAKFKGEGTPGEHQEKVFRVALNFSKILEIPALNQREVFGELKKSKLGDFIERDNLTFIGS